MLGASQADAWRTKDCLLTTNYEPKSASRRPGDRSDEKLVIVRGALKYLILDSEKIIYIIAHVYGGTSRYMTQISSK